MLRALEILLGLILGCFGLLFSVGAVGGDVALFQKMLAGGETTAVDFLVCLALTLPALIFLAAWMLLRTPRASGTARRWVRWLAVASTGTTLILLVAIAVPNFLRFGGASVASEPRIIISVIRTSEESYFAEFGEYVAFNSVPSGLLEAQLLSTRSNTPKGRRRSAGPSTSRAVPYGAATRSP